MKMKIADMIEVEGDPDEIERILKFYFSMTKDIMADINGMNETVAKDKTANLYG